MSTSQATLLKDLVREYGLGRAGTATSATTTTLVDASDFGGPIPGGVFPNGSPIRITSGAAIGLNSYKNGAIDPSTGTITMSPAAAGNTGTPTFVMSTVVEHIDRLLEAQNRALQRRCSRVFKTCLTDVPDGDFLGALNAGVVTDHWTISGAAGHPVPSYANLAFPDGFSARGIQILSAGVNEYMQSDNIPVHPLTTRYFMGFVRVTAAGTTGEFILRDITNTAVITPTFEYGAATSTSKSFVLVKGSYIVPAGCSQVAWRLNVQESGKTAIFGPLMDVEQGQRTFATQPHLNSDDDIGAFYQGTVQETGAIANPGPETITYRPYLADGMSFSDHGWGYAMQFDSSPPFPTWYDEYGFYPALTSDTDTTDCPEPLVLCATAMELYKMLTNESGEKPTFYRGRVLPTATMLKLQNAEKEWKSGFMRRLRAEKTVSVKRTFKSGVYA